MQNFPVKTLSIVGCGNLGATLGSAWRQRAILHINAIHNRSYENSLKALSYLGMDRVSEGDNGDVNVKPRIIARHLSEFVSADLWLIACPDDQIADVAGQLAERPLDWGSSVVFHCSGALSSSELAPLSKKGAATASVHPAFSFSNPKTDAHKLKGAVCTAEGSEFALSTLQPIFEGIGFHWTAISAEQKSLYHAGTVIGCNYLVALMNASLKCLVSSGLTEASARQLLTPLASQTLDNAMNQAPEDALTGPIRRGDINTINQHLRALDHLPDIQSLYRALGKQTLPIAEANLTEHSLKCLKQSLDDD